MGNRQVLLFYDDKRDDDYVQITITHYQDCCEWNYADLNQIENRAFKQAFDPLSFHIEKVEGSGFKFGDKNIMFFIPCYSVQNGYYTDEVKISIESNLHDWLTCETEIE